jgi:hypothetical protein
LIFERALPLLFAILSRLETSCTNSSFLNFEPAGFDSKFGIFWIPGDWQPGQKRLQKAAKFASFEIAC